MTPLDLLLMEYAAGTLTPYEALMVAAHLSLRPEARRRVSGYEKTCGDMIRDVPPAQLNADCLDKVFKLIDGCKDQAPAPETKQASMPRDLGIPEPVYALLKNACASKAPGWRAMTGGVMKIELRVCANEPRHRKLRLMRLAPRQSAPAHAHAGREITLVLDGGFTDASGHYARGDILIIDDGFFVHSPVADDTGCLALSLTEAPLRFRNPIASLLNWFLRY